ncbi:uncharacterized protein LOC110848338 [Folsomia candida]|uniref:uncharacterized protein LOC110848338 n=1 Tax=Folsomia candida TaxID=158441 RepID=UPI001604F2BC|nr:uncharacterized protein LOC110848338 [Folsomia candida]
MTFQCDMLPRSTSPGGTESTPSICRFEILTPFSLHRAQEEHNYANSPPVDIKIAYARQESLKKRLRNAKLSLLRRRRSIKKIKANLSDKLRECKKLGANQFDALRKKFPALLNQVLDQQLQAHSSKGKTRVRYNNEVKKFAKTLHFMSPKAYSFLQKHITLPHESTLSSWTSSVDCSPGFSKDVMARLSEARQNDNTNFMTDVVLQVDEMAIRKDTPWCNHLHKYEGFVTPIGIGGILECDGTEELATSALVVLLAGVCGGWEIPSDSFSPKKSTKQPYGYSANCKMFEKFGLKEKPEIKGSRNLDMIDIHYEDIHAVLDNPVNPARNFGAIFDVCHVLKLFRNLLAQCEGIQDDV